jgi:hypothetical protein
MKFGIDNDVTIYINGQLVASVTAYGANYDDFIVPVPDGLLQPGANLLVALATDRGGSTAFDVTLTTDPTPQPTLFRYGSSGYRYAITAGGFPPGVELPSFDDSGYAIGTAPFGNGGYGIYSAATYWPENTRLIARLHFNVVGAPSGVRMKFGIDNDVTIYINGQLVASVTADGANYDDFIVPVPDGVVHAGANLLVALAVDRGGSTAFDVAMTTDTVTPVTRITWGRLKAIYR